MKRLKLGILLLGLLPLSSAAQKGKQAALCCSKMQSLYQKKKYTEALKHFEKLEKSCAIQAPCIELLGDIYGALEAFPEAFATYRLIEKVHPTLVRGYEIMGDFYTALKDWPEAIQTYTRGIQNVSSDTDRRDLIIERAIVLTNTRRYKEAISDLEALSQRFPENTWAKHELAIAYSGNKEVPRALSIFKDLHQLDSMDVAVLTCLSDAYQKLGEHPQAITFAQRAIQLDPTGDIAYVNLAYSKMKLGNLDEALQDIEKAIAMDKENGYAYRNRGLIYLEMKDPEKACRSFLVAEQKGYSEMYDDDVKALIQQHCQ